MREVSRSSGLVVLVASMGALLAACSGADSPGVNVPPVPNAPPGATATPTDPSAPAASTPAPSPAPVTGIACVGVTARGEVLALDPDADKVTPLGEARHELDVYGSFGIRGRDLYACVDGEVVRSSLDTKDEARSEVSCSAVTADEKAIWVHDVARLTTYPSWEALLAKKPSTQATQMIAFAIGASPAGVLASEGGREVVLLDRTTGARTTKKLDAEPFLRSVTGHGTDILVLAAFDEDKAGGVLVFDARGALKRRAFADRSFVGIACAR